ncbi:MAG TPA: hypothetical protein VGS11_06325 [Candidatus Bathyarchaeia archaeon]|nr:hypothetical protein [Candidatus Bathyarchaeia archaeon]
MIDKKNDTIICVSSGQDRSRRIQRLLDRNGFRTRLLTPHGENPVQTSLEVAIHLQQLALTPARKRGMKDPAFVADSSRLKLSSKMIY